MMILDPTSNDILHRVMFMPSLLIICIYIDVFVSVQTKIVSLHTFRPIELFTMDIKREKDGLSP